VTEELVYRELAADAVFRGVMHKGEELRVSECGTQDDNDVQCVDANRLWINASCGIANDEVLLNREEIMALAATLIRWAETGVLCRPESEYRLKSQPRLT
jgi:hypothetical protein